jgi:hypothetical protein
LNGDIEVKSFVGLGLAVGETSLLTLCFSNLDVWVVDAVVMALLEQDTRKSIGHE